MKLILLICPVFLCINKSISQVKLITLAPGHFHAALVQKTSYPGVNDTVFVYAPKGPDLGLHLDKIKLYNNRLQIPTHWEEKVYVGDDFFDEMLEEKKGNVIVLSGNNRLKSSYILKSIERGFNILGDKPMAINIDGFNKLRKAFEIAEKNKMLIYDIMTERYEITNLLQRKISMEPTIFGTLLKGTIDDPAVTKISVHHLYKYVSGFVLTRPTWYLDVDQQGEGIVDVTTHLVDLIQWECFPDQVLDYTKDIHLNNAKKWVTSISKNNFIELTKENNFPDYLKQHVNRQDMLEVMCNGEFNYTIKGIHAKVSVTWNYKAPDGTGDTHYSIMKGSKANLIIKQGVEEKYQPTLYIEAKIKDNVYIENLEHYIQNLNTEYNGLSIKKTEQGWMIVIPDIFKESHEIHFSRVMEKYLHYLKNHDLPKWEIPNMITKYYTTTLAQKNAIVINR